MKNEKLITRSFTFEGKRYFVRAATEVEAEVKKAMKLRDLEEGRVALTKDMPFRQWANMCIDTYKTNCSEERRQAYISTLKENIYPIIGSKKLRSITSMDCQNVLNNCRFDNGKMKSRYTVRQCKYLLNFIFSYAKANRILTENPAEFITMPSTEPPKKRRAFNAEEERIFLELAEQNNRFRLFELMYYCGCRQDEDAGVKGSDIYQIRGQNMLHIHGTKTQNADRTVPIPDILYEKIKGTPGDAYIAPTTVGKRYDQWAYQRVIKTLRRQMNIAMGCKVYNNELIPPFPLAEDFVPYFFRHTFCCNLQKKGVDIRTAQALMGHADITTTANIYTHSDDELLVAAAETINSQRHVARRKLKKIQCD